MSEDSQETIVERAGRALIEAVGAPAKVILYGSRIRGNGDVSNLDFLVIEETEDRMKETARLNAILGRLLIPSEVVVVDREQVDKLGDVPGTTIHEALNYGRVIAES